MNYIALLYIISLDHSTHQNSTLHYTTLIAPHSRHNCRCNYTKLSYTTPQLQLHYTSYNYNCATPHYIQQLWLGVHCNLCNHCKDTAPTTIRSVIHESQQRASPISFLFLKLPPHPCAVLVVYSCILHTVHSYTQSQVHVHRCKETMCVCACVCVFFWCKLKFEHCR